MTAATSPIVNATVRYNTPVEWMKKSKRFFHQHLVPIKVRRGNDEVFSIGLSGKETIREKRNHGNLLHWRLQSWMTLSLSIKFHRSLSHHTHKQQITTQVLICSIDNRAFWWETYFKYNNKLEFVKSFRRLEDAATATQTFIHISIWACTLQRERSPALARSASQVLALIDTAIVDESNCSESTVKMECQVRVLSKQCRLCRHDGGNTRRPWCLEAQSDPVPVSEYDDKSARNMRGRLVTPCTTLEYFARR